MKTTDSGAQSECATECVTEYRTLWYCSGRDRRLQARTAAQTAIYTPELPNNLQMDVFLRSKWPISTPTQPNLIDRLFAYIKLPLRVDAD